MADLFRIENAPTLIPPEGVSEGWVPTEHMDEVSPPCRETPSDWLVAGDVWRLAPFDGAPGEPGRALAEGETVSFEELTKFPSVRAVWNGPNDYELLSPVPQGATLFWLPFDSDTLAGSIEDFMRDNGDMDAFLPGEEFEVRALDWSTSSFTLTGGRFVAADQVEALDG